MEIISVNDICMYHTPTQLDGIPILFLNCTEDNLNRIWVLFLVKYRLNQHFLNDFIEKAIFLTINMASG